MVKAFLRWEQVSLLERPGAWCHHVLLNACRSWWRRRRTEQRFLLRFPQRTSNIDGPSADVIAFWSVVRTMPTRPRMVVALYFAGDHSTADIAAILECPEGTVRSDLSRARLILADELGH
jgi:RNA polymerase sigma-70 factor, ECF subfamily